MKERYQINGDPSNCSACYYINTDGNYCVKDGEPIKDIRTCGTGSLIKEPRTAEEMREVVTLWEARTRKQGEV